MAPLHRSLSLQKPTPFISDEWSTPTFVRDLLLAVRLAFNRQDALPNRTLNVGGPERLSQAQMATALAEVGRRGSGGEGGGGRVLCRCCTQSACMLCYVPATAFYSFLARLATPATCSAA